MISRPEKGHDFPSGKKVMISRPEKSPARTKENFSQLLRF
jgi:hypothetical protein